MLWAWYDKKDGRVDGVADSGSWILKRASCRRARRPTRRSRLWPLANHAANDLHDEGCDSMPRPQHVKTGFPSSIRRVAYDGLQQVRLGHLELKELAVACGGGVVENAVRPGIDSVGAVQSGWGLAYGTSTMIEPYGWQQTMHAKCKHVA
eukprot:3392683-Pleurochrysis_carterae.AAC.6